MNRFLINACTRNWASRGALAGLIAFASLIVGEGGLARADYIALNTGQGSSGEGSIDPLWRVTYDAGAGQMDTQVKTVENSGFPFPAWVADSADSHWVIPTDYSRNNAPPPAADPPIDFTYYVQFQLNQDQLSSGPMLAGRWASDNNTFMILLNGNTISPNSNTLATSYTDWSTLTGSGAGDFKLGTNVLEFHVYNQPQNDGNPSGFRFEGGVTANAVPEPGSLVLSAVGALVLGGLSWKRRIVRRVA